MPSAGEGDPRRSESQVLERRARQPRSGFDPTHALLLEHTPVDFHVHMFLWRGPGAGRAPGELGEDAEGTHTNIPHGPLSRFAAAPDPASR